MRIGYDVVGRSWMYTRSRSARPRTLRPRHSVENQWDLLAPLGIAPARPDRAPGHDGDRPGGGARRSTRAWLPPASTRSDRLVVMHVSAGNPFRRWPIPAFAAVAAGLAAARAATAGSSSPPALRATPRPTVVIAAARAEPADAERDRVLSCGEFSLTELRALVDRAALYIGGDSGPMHIAATSHVPIVSLYGPTLPARSAPWRAPHWPARGGRDRRTALPAVRPAGLRARRFPLPDVDSARAGDRCRRAAHSSLASG